MPLDRNTWDVGEPKHFVTERQRSVNVLYGINKINETARTTTICHPKRAQITISHFIYLIIHSYEIQPVTDNSLHLEKSNKAPTFLPCPWYHKLPSELNFNLAKNVRTSPGAF